MITERMTKTMLEGNALLLAVLMLASFLAASR